MTASISVGPSPARARATASRGGVPHGDRVVAVDRDRGHVVGLAALAIRSTAVAIRSGVCSPYWLFWQTNTTGSFHTAAMFRASWKAPMLLAPSPKLTTVTRSVPSSWAASARPLAIGMPPPTMPVVTISPDAGWVMCIGPPLPLQVPVARPRNSAHSSRSGTPLARWSCRPR